MTITQIISSAGKVIAEKGTEEIVENASKIYEIIRGSYTPLSQEIIVECPENKQKYSIAFEAKGGYLPKKIKFLNGKPVRVNLRPLRSGQDISNAINLLENGFELSTSAMSKEDLFLLDIEYKISNPDYLNSLVERNRAKEVPKDKEDEYWMHAELKHPKALKTKYGRLDLRDIDFTVDVGITEDVNLIIPPSFRTEMEASIQVLDELNPRDKYVKGLWQIRAKKTRKNKKNIIAVANNIQNLFLPQKFCNFIEVKQDFRFMECMRGQNYYENISSLYLPKTMEIVSRTDLGLEKFASHGVLIYKKESLLTQISKIIGIR